MIDFGALLKLFGEQQAQAAPPPTQAQPQMPEQMPGQPQPPVNTLHSNAFDNMMAVGQGKKSGGALGSILKLMGL